MMHKNKSVDVNRFAMVQRPDVPRASFEMQTSHKTTFDSGYLVPFYLQEVLPGDTFKVRSTLFARMATPLFPALDNLHLETFYFFVPNRLVWSNWEKFMGSQNNPGDSISYVIPKTTSPASGYTVGSLQDFFGLPTVGQVTGGLTVTHSVLPLRGYNLIYNEWFRDENLQNSVPENIGDGPDASTDYVLLRRGKRKDYFTGALPWAQKGTAVTLPLGTTAPVKLDSYTGTSVDGLSFMIGGNGTATPGIYSTTSYGSSTGQANIPNGTAANLYADLSQATAATINQIRQAFQIQKLLERDARGGTRYTEILTAHFGVHSPDARLQRPEYLGGSTAPVIIQPVAQTQATGASGTTSPQGNLAAYATSLNTRSGFTQSFVEHGYVFGLVNVRADLNYQQGLDRHWSRNTRYDFYFPAFAYLGEQAVLNKEIYVTGTSAQDDAVFGYQERWAEYRYMPTKITGLFRSTSAGTLDMWHYAQRFTSLPTLNTTFIQDTPPLSRTLAAGVSANNQQFLLDSITNIRAARPLPLFSAPGLIDHF